MYPLRRYSRKSPWYPILVLETITPRAFRRNIIMLTTGWGVVTLVAYALLQIVALPVVAPSIDPAIIAVLSVILSDRLLGVFLVLLGVAAWFVGLEAFYRSYYFDDISGKRTFFETLFSFEVAWILHTSRSADPLLAFLSSIYGEKIMRRLGLGREVVKDFLTKHSQVVNFATIPELPISKTDEITLPEFVDLLAKGNSDFVTFLAEYEIKVSDLIGATEWVVWKQEVVDTKERWWSAENLSRVPSLGASWSYGHTPFVDRYSSELLDDPAVYVGRFMFGSRDKEVRNLETVLSREAEANAILIAPPGNIKMDVIYQLVATIRSGATVAALKHKRPVLLQVSVFLAGCKTKSDFETALIKFFTEATKAGNIVLVIDNLPNLVAGAAALQVNAPALLDPYLKSSLIQVIALADTDAFYRVINPEASLLNRFEKVEVEDLSVTELVRMLEVKLLDFEYETEVRVTYPALVLIIESAESFFNDGALQDKSVDLLIEILSVYGGRPGQDITKADVYAYIKSKTSIPVGEIGADEKEILLNLEGFLGKRVIGQLEAIKIVSGAMRRARASVRNIKRPIGSFLFLGPTGVGKTETAKALAESFFGSDEAMNRLDMSEYQGADSLERLLGSFADNKAGVFTTMMRSRPYGVLLLDEFEKANADVHNLFLQILDEGFFSDMAGKRINVRNTIVIATSNAGADYIWDLTTSDKFKGQNLSAVRDQLVDHIIQTGVYRPELLNRFDAVVVFEPLSSDELVKIATLMLARLAKRLENQGLTLIVTPELATFVAEKGANQVFGARPMQRFIQDTVEETIAKKIIEGTISRGMSFSLVSTETGDLQVVLP